MTSKVFLLLGLLLVLGVEGLPQQVAPSAPAQPQPPVPATNPQPGPPAATSPQQSAPAATTAAPVAAAPVAPVAAPVAPVAAPVSPVAAPVAAPVAPVAAPVAQPQVPSTPTYTAAVQPQQPAPGAIFGIPPAEPVGNGKFAVVFTGRTITWNRAAQACQMIPVPAGATGVSLFTANTPSDSSWLAGRMNSPFGSSEYWVGLKSGPTYGTVSWVDATPFTYSHTAILSGYDDPTKVFAIASPDGFGIKYDFQTPTDEADGYICQYRMPTATAQG